MPLSSAHSSNEISNKADQRFLWGPVVESSLRAIFLGDSVHMSCCRAYTVDLYSDTVIL